MQLLVELRKQVPHPAHTVSSAETPHKGSSPPELLPDCLHIQLLLSTLTNMLRCIHAMVGLRVPLMSICSAFTMYELTLVSGIVTDTGRPEIMEGN